MNEDALRALVRETIARHLPPAPRDSREEPWRGHESHVLLKVASGEDLDGPCLIEPSVRCNHCGYCQSVGH
jgi:hypothetical protein